jgi:beta-glucosidase
MTAACAVAQPPVAGAVNACTPETCAYLNPKLPAEQRAKDLVKRMTLDEKALQMIDVAPAIPRLGVPEYNWWNEALHGVARNGYATNFPQAIGMAATWDAELIRQEGRVIAVEGRAKYNEALRNNNHARYAGLTFWSPNINIFRDPRWGRGQETYGEDPYLTARMGVEFVRALQGDDPNYLELVATPKHYAVHSGPEPLRHGFNVPVSLHDLEDTYLPAFRATIVDAKADSIMCAYNAVDGQPACASGMLLGQHLRGDWGFTGFVVSDCDAIDDIHTGHHYANSSEQASAQAVKAGTDLDCGAAYKALPAAVRQGMLGESDMDTSLVRLFTARMRLGMFDPPESVPFHTIPYSEVDSPAHRELALRAARESIVLLENHNQFLPLKPSIRKIAVIGPTADLIEAIEGNYNATSRNPVTPLKGLQKQFGAANVFYAPGTTLAAGTPAPIPSEYLRTDATLQTAGLKGEYFDNIEFQGEPKLVRVDPRINFNWNQVLPAPDFPTSDFAVRWTGVLVPPQPGAYGLSFRGLRYITAYDPANGSSSYGPDSRMYDRIRLYVDGKLVLTMNSKPQSARLTFDDTKPHEIRIEYAHISSDRFVDFEWDPPVGSMMDVARKAVQSADAIVAVVGLSSNLEGEEMNVHVDGFDGGDRTDIHLPAVQQQLLEELKATGKPLVVVLTSGSALAVDWAKEHADALLQAWYPGEEGGTAIADTLVGKNNPSGKLPVTFYRDTTDMPPLTDYSMANRTYRYYKGPVLYPFGYGLSYTQFSFGKPELSSSQIQAGAPLTASVEVRNTGKVEGDEVAELYVAPPQTAVSPRWMLAGFERVHLGAGESRRVTFHLSPRDLSLVDEKGNRAVVAGSYGISIAGSLPTASTPEAKVKIGGQLALPR